MCRVSSKGDWFNAPFNRSFNDLQKLDWFIGILFIDWLQKEYTFKAWFDFKMPPS